MLNKLLNYIANLCGKITPMKTQETQSMRSTEIINRETVTQNGVTYEHTYFGSHMQVRGSDGSFSEYFNDHYSRVRRTRDELGMKHVSHSQKIDHLFVGKKIVEKETQKIYEVQSVSKQWWRGWHLVALVCHNGSHGTRVIENISSIDPTIIQSLEEFHQEYDLVN